MTSLTVKIIPERVTTAASLTAASLGLYAIIELEKLRLAYLQLQKQNAQLKKQLGVQEK